MLPSAAMALVLTAFAATLLGYELAVRIWPDRETIASTERALYGLVIGSTLWLGTSWLLALSSLLRPPFLFGRSVALLVAAAILVWQRREQFRQWHIEPNGVTSSVLLTLPLVIWVGFALWRGAIIPPLTHDALSYHLPKAVLYMRSGGYDALQSLQWLFAVRPANYEILLADVLAVAGTDAWTEWISTFFYGGIILAAVALAERWWGPNLPASIGVALATGSVPVLLLHSSAHKNDVMASFFAASGIVAASRFMGSGEFRSLAIAVIAFMAAIGTKANMLIVTCCVAPLLLWRFFTVVRAERRSRSILLLVSIGVLSFLLLGGIVFIERLFPGDGGIATSADTVLTASRWGQWENLWQAPYIMLAAPFSTDAYALRVPWDSRPWFWRRNEIYFSHNGWMFALCVLALPIAIWLLRRNESRRAERVLISLAVLAAFIIHLPVRYTPSGLLSISLPRFTLFIIPIVFAWTLAALLRWLSSRWRVASMAALISLSLFFIFEAIESASDDVFAPLDYVVWAAAHPGTRSVPFDPHRAACVADRRAGPHEKIAIYPGSGAWVLPAYGAALTRPVEYLPRSASKAEIPDDAQWVVIDTHYEVVWTGSSFRTLGDRQLGTGPRNPQAVAIMESLRADPRFEAIAYRPRAMQAVFRRRST